MKKLRPFHIIVILLLSVIPLMLVFDALFMSDTKYLVFKGVCVEGDCQNGEGKEFNYGRWYVGEFKNGKEHGQGAITFPDGQEYVGEWKEGAIHGQGTWTHPEGHKYVGGFKDWDLTGHGTFVDSNGEKYVGEYKASKRHGRGILIDSSGAITEGFWMDDEYAGKIKPISIKLDAFIRKLTS